MVLEMRPCLRGSRCVSFGIGDWLRVDGRVLKESFEMRYVRALRLRYREENVASDPKRMPR